MNADQVGAIVRAVLQAASGFFIAKGWIDQESSVVVTGAVVSLVTVVWSVYLKHRG